MVMLELIPGLVILSGVVLLTILLIRKWRKPRRKGGAATDDLDRPLFWWDEHNFLSSRALLAGGIHCLGAH